MSQGMTDFLRNRYAVDTTPIVHPIVQPVPAFTDVPAATPPYRLAFSGNINFTVAERVRHVIEAVGDNPLYEIVLYTPVSPEDARETIGAWADNVTIAHLSDQKALVDALRGCDVMMLALVDRRGSSSIEDDFKTQFPTRTLEMLISERPLLVIAPADYYITRFFQMNGAGRTYSGTDIDELREVILDMCTNSALRKSCVRNALATAQSYRVNEVVTTLRRELKADRRTK